MKRYISDCHLHSEFSFDSEAKIKDICETAIKKGYSAITITDHCECNAKIADDNFSNDTQASYIESCKMKEYYKNHKNFSVYAGVEIGQAIENESRAKEILNKYNFDFVLASLHNLPGVKDFYYIYNDETERRKLLDKYFYYVAKLVQWENFDSLAHLTYPFRYISVRDKMNIKVSEFYEPIQQILKLLVKHNKAMEVNTSGLWQSLGETLPPFDVIKMFKDLGGKYITIGSDAHAAENLGKGIDEALELIKKAGFDSYTIYENRKPKLIKI